MTLLRPQTGLMFLLVFAALALPAGCGDFVRQAEAGHKIALATTDEFLKFETENREQLPVEVSEAADRIRLTAPPVFTALHDAIQAYKQTPTETGRSRILDLLDRVNRISLAAEQGVRDGREAMRPAPADPTPADPADPAPPAFGPVE